MKNILKTKGVLIVSILLLLIIFIFGGMFSRYMTEQISVHQEERYRDSLLELVENGKTLETFEPTEVDVTYTILSEDREYQPEIIEAYYVRDDNENLVAVIYVLSTFGCEDGLVSAYAISTENNELINIKVISHNETVSVAGQFYNLLDESFFNQFENKNLDVIDLSIDSKAGATYSSRAFEQGVKFARELYAADFEFEIPSLQLTINDVYYNYDFSTMVDYPLIADVTFGRDNNVASIYIDSDFTYQGLASGVEPPQEVKDNIKVYVEDSKIINHVVEDMSYNETNHEIVVKVFGYSSQGITVTVTLNDSETAITNIVLTETHESYDADYNARYTGNDVPAVEEQYIDEYLNNDVIIDTVAAATVTSDAMEAVIEWIDGLDATLNGGG
ncbi:MAG: FMN-binding protein [Candidatus Izimaplasma sp.]|nr:FMN-binding protein [Candidatus Izimaplasma bacterium]